MNNNDRSQWIDNDEGLYNWWRGTRLSKRAFILKNRRAIDAVIDTMTSGKQPYHFLAGYQWRKK